ncbi:hypothetical protein GCM10023264_16880 [Sphingomonas daechungensis]|uniref:ubiquinol-cytochrome C chaperone family protein n=1 Tax=Sphingomonas daechungensis TaxID=1176646 RepID=UPI0031E789DF
MFRALFARLTDEPKRGQALFRLAVAEARRPDWYLRGQVPDTVNGRFAVLATIVALLMVRLDRDGEPGKDAGTALTERLVESLDAEIREMGTGDPTLGKQVRQLVGAVAGRADRWGKLVATTETWGAELRRSVYLDETVATEALDFSESALRIFWARIEESRVEDLIDGKIG